MINWLTTDEITERSSRLKVFQIKKEEQRNPYREFKVRMPPGFDCESGNTFARIREVDIEFNILPSAT